MKTNTSVTLTDEERLSIANSLGQRAMLSRKDVNNLIGGFFQGLKDSSEETPKPTKKKNLDKKPKAVVRSSPLLEDKVSEWKRKGKDANWIFSYRNGWNKTSIA